MLPQLIRQRAQECPDRIFIRHVDAGTLTYRQLHDAAMRWAASYRRAAVMPGDPVLTMLPLNLDFYCSAIGLAWILGVEVPVNTEYRGQLLLHAIRSAQPKVIVAHSDYVHRFEEIAAELDSRPLLVIVDAEESLPQTSYPAVTLGEVPAGCRTRPGPRRTAAVGRRLDHVHLWHDRSVQRGDHAVGAVVRGRHTRRPHV